MTIVEKVAAARSRVFWIGAAPSADQAGLLTRLQLVLDNQSPITNLASDEFLAASAAVVVAQGDRKPAWVTDLIRLYGSRILDFDCHLIVLCGPNALASVINTLKAKRLPSIWPTAGPDHEVYEDGFTRSIAFSGEPLFPHARVYREPVAIELLANLILSWRATGTIVADHSSVFRTVGPAAASLKPPQRLLLRKSFADCEEVHLRRLDDGRSPAQVFVAHAQLRQGQLIPRPMPHFVKIGPRQMIAREWRNYELFVRQFVPFHLGPRLVRERCALGAHKGIIVGDFVDDSESLKECAVTGRSPTPIGTLFDRTLRGWHYPQRTENRSLSVVMRQFLAGKMEQSRIAEAQGLGANVEPKVLKRMLESQPAEELTWGRIHGDLHADNVRVRHADAILIDFFSSRNGPLIIDAAALEVGIVIRAPKEDAFDFDSWRRVVSACFRKEYFQGRPIAVNQTEQYAWIASALRQVRLYAYSMQVAAGQYVRVLAFHLYRSACKDPGAPFGEGRRRAYAYVLAEQLLAMKW